MPSPGVVTAALPQVVVAASSGSVTTVTSEMSDVGKARVKTTRGTKNGILSPATSQDADGFILVGARKERREKHKRHMPTAVIGTRTGPNELRVMNERSIPVVISRLGPSVTVDDVTSYVRHVQKLR